MTGDVLTLPFATTAATGTALAAFEELFRVHGTRMKSLAYNLLGNRQDAEDAVQEAFLKTYRSLSRFREGAAMHTWAYRILINTCLDEWRRRQRRSVSALSERTVASHSPSDLGYALRQAIQMLPERQRSVFLMAAVEGLPHADIAVILEITEGNSRSLLFDARARLQSLLSL